METIYQRCCGIDVHKSVIVACLRDGRKTEIRSYGATTGELRKLAEWLLESKCEICAMESTGSYWKPVYNVMEALGVEIIVVNAQHIKNVPGRKTDAKDSEWIAQLLQCGLLKPSYIPSREQRELREVSRYRKSLVEERARELNRLSKMLEGGNIKITSVVRDVNGMTSRNLIGAMLGDGVHEDNIDNLLCGSLREKRDELLKACDGYLTSLQKKLIRAILDHIDDMTRRINDMDSIIRGQLEKEETALKRLQELPGIAERSAQIILAEIGTDMSRFPTAGHLSRWCGLAPGNNESAQKRKSGKTTKGNNTLKTTMIQCAQIAKRTKGSFFKAQFERLVVRRGKNRATVAVAHSMIIAIYHIMKDGVPFVDLGENYYSLFNTEKKINYYLKKLESLGWTPSITLA